MARKKLPLLAQPRFPEIGPARMVNGYIAYYTKEKHTVYEHQLVAEKMLGRSLVLGEIAHHKNEVRHDNRDSNIEIKTNSGHSKDHNVSRIPAERQSRNRECPTCHKISWMTADRIYCSLSCVPRPATPGRPTKDQLAQMCEQLTNVAIAKIYGVSETCVQKWKRILK